MGSQRTEKTGKGRVWRETNRKKLKLKQITGGKGRTVMMWLEGQITLDEGRMGCRWPEGLV
jgi:hypothetical protein